jgi:hypothetical protein
MARDVKFILSADFTINEFSASDLYATARGMDITVGEIPDFLTQMRRKGWDLVSVIGSGPVNGMFWIFRKVIN